MCTLRELYGPAVEKVCPYPSLQLCPADALALQLKIDQRVFVTPSKRKLDVNVVQSNYHIELTPSWVALRGERIPLTSTAGTSACMTAW